MYRLLRQAYHELSNLYSSNNAIKPHSDIHQGDSFVPAHFSLGLDGITKCVDAEFSFLVP